MRVKAAVSFLVLIVLLELFLVSCPAHATNTETRYMRNSAASINGATFQEFNATQTVSDTSSTKTLASASSEYLYPTSDGSPLQWQTTTGTVHYSLIDEASADDTDSVGSKEATTPDNKIDRYGHTALSTTSAISRVSLVVRRKGLGSIYVGWVIGSTFYSQTVTAGGSSWATTTVSWDVSPATSVAWTKAEVNGASLQIKQYGTNGQVANVSQLYARVIYYTDATAYWGFTVSKRDSGGTETNVTNGVQTFLTSTISAFLLTSGQLYSTTWACPQTVLASTDSVVVGVFYKVSSWLIHTTYNFSTEQLGAASLDSSTWTLYFYLSPYVTVSVVSSVFRWGSSTYNSCVENFVWTATSGQSLTFTLNEQLIATASQSTGKATLLQFGDSVTTLPSAQESVAKAFTLSGILQALDSCSTSKSLAFSASDLLQILGGSSLSKALGFTNYDILAVLGNSTLGKELWLIVFDILQILENNSLSKSVILQFFDAVIIYDNVSVGVAKSFMGFEVFDLVKIVDYVVPQELFDMAMNFFLIMACVPFALALGIVFYRRRRKRLETPSQP